jgi:hypothetical protein
MGHGLDRRLHARDDLRRARVARDPGQVELERRERAADVVVDLARDRRALVLDAGLQMLGKLVQALLRRHQVTVGLDAGALGLGGIDRVQQRRHEPGEVALLEVVARAVSHRLDRGLVADLARDEDERNVARARLQQLEREQAGKARQVVVGHHHVPGLDERFEEGVLGIDPARLRDEAAAHEVGQEQFVIELRVLEMKDPKHAVPGLRRHGVEYGAGLRAPS